MNELIASATSLVLHKILVNQFLEFSHLKFFNVDMEKDILSTNKDKLCDIWLWTYFV